MFLFLKLETELGFFFVVDMGPWLISNLSARHVTEEGNPWSVVFGGVVWLIFCTYLFILVFYKYLKNNNFLYFFYFKLIIFYIFISF